MLLEDIFARGWCQLHHLSFFAWFHFDHWVHLVTVLGIFKNKKYRKL